ncbi:hypothetical protein [Halalkalibacter krulwichiae]|uniref:Uncharacterized protein n=1 Tax=Halalkalibacter krulwichiae TaxID=199441 RepID=A0A1X9M5P8_9BACI|nr:hypothetical protein [Halalkalibacter krulwichiae]ARK28769.1 hypothetical protein BkAM31D_02280 [Halalkalibacter krulwichiae]
MIHIKHCPQYTDVYKGNWIVARIYEDGNGGKFVKVLADGYDAVAASEAEALSIIKGRVM